MPVSSSAIREHGKLCIEEDFSGEDLSDEEDTADFIDRTPLASLLKPSILERACQRNPFLIVCFIPKPKENQAAHEFEDLDAEENRPEESLSECVLAFQENQPADGSENSRYAPSTSIPSDHSGNVTVLQRHFDVMGEGGGYVCGGAPREREQSVSRR
ncbi:hypothetical protein E4U61_006837 [Claviceps capensis]|nr:hypothetical protein E4U61_006837 [Claviceps capensis]